LISQSLDPESLFAFSFIYSLSRSLCLPPPLSQVRNRLDKAAVGGTLPS
jgi:hypothetical protein